MPTYTPENSIFDGPIANLPSVVCILIETISRARAKGGKSLSGLKFATFVGCVPSDGAASMAVKGLICAVLKPFTLFNYYLLLQLHFTV